MSSTTDATPTVAAPHPDPAKSIHWATSVTVPFRKLASTRRIAVST